MPTPRENVAAECARHGEREVVARCVTLIEGGDADDAFLMAISCGAAGRVLEGREGAHCRKGLNAARMLRELTPAADR